MVYSGFASDNVRHVFSIAAKRLRTVLRRRALRLLHMNIIDNAIVEHEPTYLFACQHQDHLLPEPKLG